MKSSMYYKNIQPGVPYGKDGKLNEHYDAMILLCHAMLLLVCNYKHFISVWNTLYLC